MENTIFTESLNELLKEEGYIDTTKKILKDSYLNNLLLEATIEGYNVHSISNVVGTRFLGAMFYIELTIEWDVLDYYKNSIYKMKTTTSSGMFPGQKFKEGGDAMADVTKDAIEYALIEFVNSKKVTSLLKDRSEQDRENSFTEIVIPKAKRYVSNLQQSIKSSVTIKNSKGHGSGFVISSDGYIITNYHVVYDTTELKVVTNDEKEYDVEVVRVSKIHDLALLKIKAKNLMPYKIVKSKDIEIAMDVYAVGTPSAEDLAQTISKGIISGVRKTDGKSKLIQTDASINSGNSGGAIINKNGEVIGVVSSKLKGFGIEGVAFGIPAYEIFDRLKIKAL